VVREAARMRTEPPPAIFDPDDALEWVVQRLPDLVAATLTRDDVARIIRFQLEFLSRKGVATNGADARPRAPVVFGFGETVDYVVARCAETGEAYLPEQVAGVVETQVGYLRHIGALGSQADPGEVPPGR
jgi:hypothetical protein